MTPGNWRARRRGSPPIPIRAPARPPTSSSPELRWRRAIGTQLEARLSSLVERQPGLPLPLYVEARLLYDEGRYNDALPLFERAASDSERAGDGPQIADLHFHAGDTFLRLERYAEAEYQLWLELTRFPRNMRARSALATLYHTTGRTREAADMVADLVRLTPTPEGYAMAARLWTTFGNRREAAALRVKARQLFAPRRSAARVSPPSPVRSAVRAKMGRDVVRRSSRSWSSCLFRTRHRVPGYMKMLP